MDNTTSLEQFRDFCNSHVQHALDEGEVAANQLSGDNLSVHYETASNVRMTWLNGSVVEVNYAHESPSGADKELTVDYSVVPPQVNEVVTTAASRRSRTLKGSEMVARLEELSRYIGVIPLFDEDVVSEVMPEADRVVSRLLG